MEDMNFSLQFHNVLPIGRISFEAVLPKDMAAKLGEKINATLEEFAKEHKDYFEPVEVSIAEKQVANAPYSELIKQMDEVQVEIGKAAGNEAN